MGIKALFSSISQFLGLSAGNTQALDRRQSLQAVQAMARLSGMPLTTQLADTLQLSSRLARRSTVIEDHPQGALIKLDAKAVPDVLPLLKDLKVSTPYRIAPGRIAAVVSR